MNRHKRKKECFLASEQAIEKVYIDIGNKICNGFQLLFQLLLISINMISIIILHDWRTVMKQEGTVTKASR